jgi:hypothetical protein
MSDRTRAILLIALLMLFGIGSAIVVGRSARAGPHMHVVCQQKNGSNYEADDVDGMVAREEVVYVLRHNPIREDQFELKKLPSGCYARLVD